MNKRIKNRYTGEFIADVNMTYKELYSYLKGRQKHEDISYVVYTGDNLNKLQRVYFPVGRDDFTRTIAWARIKEL